MQQILMHAEGIQFIVESGDDAVVALGCGVDIGFKISKEFAQALNSYLLEKIEVDGDVKFAIPPYINDAIAYLVR